MLKQCMFQQFSNLSVIYGCMYIPNCNNVGLSHILISLSPKHKVNKKPMRIKMHENLVCTYVYIQ